MNDPSIREKIERLPKWAQDHIKDLVRQRKEAVEALDNYIDENNVGPFIFSDFVCDKDGGPSIRERHINADKVRIEYGGIMLDINLSNQYRDEKAIYLNWSPRRSKPNSIVAIVPSASNSLSLCRAVIDPTPEEP